MSEEVMHGIKSPWVGISASSIGLQRTKIIGVCVPAAPDRKALERKVFAEAFSSGLPLPATVDPHFEEAIRHVLDNPGSLVRPRIVSQMATAYGLDPSASNDLAIALEYFHTASLLFDDLPSMDDALERRGVPCVHLAFGEAGAILAALALINRAYALCWRAASGVSQDRQRRALAYIEERLGVEGLLNGQSLDLHYSTLPHNRATTEQIAQGKTVSLIRLTLVLPAILGGASVREIQLLERLAMCWGLGYQILDDLKDVLQSVAETGKTVSRDVLLDRPNIASAIGTPSAVGRMNRLLHLGGITFRSLLKSQSSLAFLGKLGSQLQEELDRVIESDAELAMGECL